MNAKDNDTCTPDAAESLLERTLSFVPRIDSRGQVVLGINIGMLYTLAVNFPIKYPFWWFYCVWGLSITLLLLSLFRLYQLAFPRLEGGGNSLLYFAEIAKLRESEFIDRFVTQSSNEHLKDVLGQVWRNSEIVSGKYVALRDGMILMGCAVPFWIASLVMATIFNEALVLK